MNWIIAGFAVLLVLASGFAAGYRKWKWRARGQREARIAHQSYRLATEMANEGFYVLSPVVSTAGAVTDWTVTDCNEQGAAYLGLQKHEVIGSNFSRFCSAASFANLLHICARAVEDGYYEDQHEEEADSPFRIRWVHRQLIATKSGLAIALRDISGEKYHALEMSRLVNEDAITTLPNRKWLTDAFPKMLEDARQKAALLFIDLDDFKNVNEALGHPVGDLLLRATAMRFKSVIGSQDQVVRLGGDEFAIVLTAMNNNGEAVRVAELVNEILRFPLELVKGKKTITASIGISIFPDDGKDTDTLLKCAEIAMYAAKDSGKAQHRFYNSSLYERLKGRLMLEHQLADAIEKDQFILHYEPRMDVASGKLSGMEALVRWQHPERGLVMPLEFIPLAESTGLILRLGDLIIDKACSQLALWRKAGLPVVPVSINISAHQFNSGNLSQTFFAAFDKYKINPQTVEIELTESTMLGDQSSTEKELAALRTIGVKLLIDDFGTGYSSLAQLQRLKMDILKVDRAFLSQLEKTAEGKIFVSAIISMAHALGMRVIAEGVETRAQLDILRSLSCDEVQGYYLSKPLPPEAMARLLADRESGLRNALPSDAAALQV
ncbi:putative bifunctional diguanylate cyclase/phosphodiesterase [Noviherbaspirillum massiliense]|nr:EAL domain-containing protein [Noviherbaspirillum massiliense]